MSKYRDKVKIITDEAMHKLEKQAEYLELAEQYKDDEELKNLYMDLASREAICFKSLHDRIGDFFKKAYERGE